MDLSLPHVQNYKRNQTSFRKNTILTLKQKLQDFHSVYQTVWFQLNQDRKKQQNPPPQMLVWDHRSCGLDVNQTRQTSCGRLNAPHEHLSEELHTHTALECDFIWGQTFIHTCLLS